MKKKIIISSLLMGSAISILPLNFIFNNKNYDEQKMENENINLNEEISNISNLDTRDGFVDALYDKNYSTLFFNNFTKPVISPNAEIPGFLGAWDTNTVGNFPTTIGWTTNNLYLSWSANLIDHPSLEGKVPFDFSPGLVTALHSDNKYSGNNKKNQVFAVVANTLDLNSRRYWILRYNTLDGTPIKDNNPEMPLMSNSPIPVMNASNGNGSAFALTNDTINNRYIAFYPGTMGNLKRDIFGFKINSNNRIEWLNNNQHFNGHPNWSGVNYDDNNIVLGLTPFNTRKSIDNASLALMVAINLPSTTSYTFKVLNLQDNLAANNNNPNTSFKPSTIIGRTAGPFNSAQGTISVPKNLLSLSAVQKNINPHLQLFNYIDQEGLPNNKVQMVVPILRNNEWVYMYLSSIFDRNRNSYYVTWGDAGSLSQGSFFASANFGGQDSMPPNIYYDEESPQDIIITAQANATDNVRFSGTQFKFDTFPFNGPWEPTSEIINSLNYISDNNNWRPKQILIKTPHINNNYLWSIPNGQTEKYISIPGGEKSIWANISSGGIKHEDFQKIASNFKWLDNQENAKFPSEITNNELETIGIENNNFFKIPDIDYLHWSAEISKREIKLFGEPKRDDSNGIIEGVFTITEDFTISGLSYLFESKIPFRVTDLKIRTGTATSISPKNSILSFLPSDLTVDNIPDLIDVVSVPNNASISNWRISNLDNSTGTATVSVDVQPHYDETNIFNPNLKTITTNLSELRKTSGTTAIQNSQANLDFTVWDIDSTNVSSFVEIIDLIPNSPTNTVRYQIEDQKPLTGELTIVVSIDGGSYYDSNNKGLPSNTSNPPLILSVPITGIKAIPDTGTLVIPNTGLFPGVFPAFIDEKNITEFFTIENQVPGSSFTITDIQRSGETAPEGSFDGTITFKIKFDKLYGKNGHIINDPVEEEYIITGLQGGPAPKYTTTFPTGNNDLFSNTLAPEINESNISQFVVLVNLPSGVTPIYEFTNQKNTGLPNTGFQQGKITIPKYFDEAGDVQDGPIDIPFTINNLKTIPAATSVRTLQGENDILPELVSEVGIERYLRIVNGSPIFNKESSIEIISNKLTSNNINGTISFEYKLINAITESGFIEESNPIPVTVSGFQKGTFTTVEQIGNFKNQKASEFDLNKDNFFTHARLSGYSIPLNTDNDGNIVSGTTIEKVEKISFNDANGVATFKISVQGGAINQQGKFTVDLVDITFTFDGFEIIAPQDNTIPIIAGSVAGGLLFIILIVVAIIIINNRRNKKILNEKRKTTTPGAPPVSSGAAKSVSPSSSKPTSIPTSPVAPGVVRPSGLPTKSTLTPSRPGTPPVTPKK